MRESPHAYDVAIANGFWSRLPFNSVARCIAAVVDKLAPSGRFFATWFDNPDPAKFDPITHATGSTSYPDMQPYHYPFAQIASVCDVLGAHAERVDETSHPLGECVMVITRGKK